MEAYNPIYYRDNSSFKKQKPEKTVEPGVFICNEVPPNPSYDFGIPHHFIKK